jgi:NAD(P)-dependent dehydrogenase (short-subunit alcohol dehydrogenase family)
MDAQEQRDQPVKAAIVTGASSGIGEATARCLAEAGFAVALAARRKQRLEQIVAEIERKGGRAIAVPTDLSDAAETSALVRETLASFGRVDLLAAMQLIGELTPVMRAQGGGRVINISSLSRYVGAPFASSYAATKGGMEAMNACMRLELAPWNIHLSIVVPGFVDTSAFETSREAGRHLRDDPHNPYRELMDHLDAFTQQQLQSAIAPQEVGALVVRVASSPRPKARYFAPKSAGTAARMFALMPEGLAERILQKMYKWGPRDG